MILNRQTIKHIDCHKDLRFKVVNKLDKYTDDLVFDYGYTYEKYNNITILSNHNEIIIAAKDKIQILNSSMDNYQGCVFGYTGLFQDTHFKSIDFSNTDTSEMRFIAYMFCNSSIDFIDMSTLDTSKVRDCEGAFSGLKTGMLDLSNINIDSLESMDMLFYKCQAKEIQLPYEMHYYHKLKNISANALFEECKAGKIYTDTRAFRRCKHKRNLTARCTSIFVSNLIAV